MCYYYKLCRLCCAPNLLCDSDPCNVNEDCSEFPNSSCINNQCICENETVCHSEDGTPITILDEICGEGDICNIENAKCIQERCKCVEGYVRSQSGKECLKSSDVI